MNRVVNWFTILLIIIFDPLAVALVIVLNNIIKTNHSAENVSKPDEEQEVESKAERVKAPTPPAPIKKDIYKEEKKKKPKRRNAYWT